MSTYYRVDVYKFGKSLGDSEEYYSFFDSEHKRFNTLDEVRTYLGEQYGTCVPKPVTSFDIDEEIGKEIVEQIGYAYHFDNADWSHSPVEKWQQRDEVFINEVLDRTVLLQ